MAGAEGEGEARPAVGEGGGWGAARQTVRGAILPPPPTGGLVVCGGRTVGLVEARLDQEGLPGGLEGCVVLVECREGGGPIAVERVRIRAAESHGAAKELRRPEKILALEGRGALGARGSRELRVGIDRHAKHTDGLWRECWRLLCLHLPRSCRRHLRMGRQQICTSPNNRSGVRPSGRCHGALALGQASSGISRVGGHAIDMHTRGEPRQDAGGGWRRHTHFLARDLAELEHEDQTGRGRDLGRLAGLAVPQLVRDICGARRPGWHDALDMRRPACG